MSTLHRIIFGDISPVVWPGLPIVLLVSVALYLLARRFKKLLDPDGPTDQPQKLDSE